MHSTQQHKESTSVPDQMAGSPTSPVSQLRQRYARFSSGTCCLLMTQQLRPTPMRNSSHWWTASHRPVRTSDWPSVWRRRMSWDRTQKHRRSLPSTIVNTMLSASSPTSAPSSLTTSHWTQRSTRGLERQLQLSPVSRLKCGEAPSCPWRQIWQYTKPCLCYQNIAVWQRDMDYVYRAGEKAQHIPPERQPPYPWNILAGQRNQRQCLVRCWSSRYVHSAMVDHVRRM